MNLFERIKLNLRGLFISEEKLLKESFNLKELLDTETFKFYLLIEKTYIDSKILCLHNDLFYEVVKDSESDKVKFEKYAKDVKRKDLLKVKTFQNTDVRKKDGPYFHYLPRNKNIESLKESDIKSFYIVLDLYCYSLDNKKNLKAYHLSYSKDSNALIPFLVTDVDFSKYKEDAYLLKSSYRDMLSDLLVYKDHLTDDQNIKELSKKFFISVKENSVMVNRASLLMWSSYILRCNIKDPFVSNSVLKFYTLNRLDIINKTTKDYQKNLYKTVKGLRRHNFLTNRILVDLLGYGFDLDVVVIKVLNEYNYDNELVNLLDYVRNYNIEDLISIKDINNIIFSDCIDYKDVILYKIIKTNKFKALINNQDEKESIKFYKDTEYVLLNLINYSISKLKDIGYIYSNGVIEDSIYRKIKYPLNILDVVFSLRQDLKLTIYEHTNEILIFLLLNREGSIYSSQTKSPVSGKSFLSSSPTFFEKPGKFRDLKKKYDKELKFDNRRFTLAYNLGLVRESELELFEETFVRDLEYNSLTELLNIYINGSDLIRKQVEESKDFYLIEEDLKFIKEGLL